MAAYEGADRRHYDRYETDVKIQFHVSFDLETKIQFRVKQDAALSPETYTAVGVNVSVEGLCFRSTRQLERGAGLLLDVYVPSATTPIRMEGRVKWSQPSEHQKGEYETGVRLMTVNGDDVEKSIFTDNVHHIRWSIVLESVFGTFKHLVLEKKKRK